MIESSREGNTVIFTFPDRITYETAGLIQEEIDSELARCEATDEIVADFALVQYISSAGLRVILKLAKATCNFSVINATSEVFEVFEVTGMAQMIDVSKKMRQISVANAVQIGSGYFSRVYRLDNDSIVKVIVQDVSIKDIKRELKLAKQAFVMGIPTAISYDIVKVDEHYGVVFELLDCDTLLEAFTKHPEKYEYYIKAYVELLKILASTKVTDDTIPEAYGIAMDKLAFLSDLITQEEYDYVERVLNSIPREDTYVHGDCHFKNIMTSNDELLLIDMDTVSKGSALFELSFMYSTYIIFSEVDPGNSLRFFGVEPEMTQNIMQEILKGYYAELDDGEYARTVDLIRFLAIFHNLFFFAKYKPDSKACYERGYKLFREQMSKLI